jgi:hypothetical protein
MCAFSAKENEVRLLQKTTETELHFCRVYRTLVAIVLLFSMYFHLFVKLVVVVWYEVNKAYLA